MVKKCQGITYLGMYLPLEQKKPFPLLQQNHHQIFNGEKCQGIPTFGT